MSLPWYHRLKTLVAPTEPIANLTLLAVVAVTLLLVWRGSPVAKAAWAVYLVSP
jgi:hypothetical protein